MSQNLLELSSTTLSGDELTVVVQGGRIYQCTTQEIANLAAGGGLTDFFDVFTDTPVNLITSTSGTSGVVPITIAGGAVSSAASGATGAFIWLAGGAGGTQANGGDIVLRGGSADPSATKGRVILAGGVDYSDGTPAAMLNYVPLPKNGVAIYGGGFATNDDNCGGDVLITAGSPLDYGEAGSGAGGNVLITGGNNNNASGGGGNIELLAGGGYQTSGGNVTVAAGTGDSNGGSVTIQGGVGGYDVSASGASGSSYGSASGGSVNIIGGDGASGGSIIIQAGAGSSQGGNVVISTGQGANSSQAGTLTIFDGVSTGAEAQVLMINASGFAVWTTLP